MKSLSRLVWWLPWFALALLGLYSFGDLVLAAVHEARAGLSWVGVAVNVVLRLVPIVLLLFALGLLIEVLVEERRMGHMRPRVQRLLFWTPRMAVLLFAFLVSLFALDVFGQGGSVWETLLALLIHLIPVGLVLAAVALAWRWEWMGALFFTVWAIWYLASARGFPPSVYLMMAGLPFALGLLFLLNWRYRVELRASV